METQFSTPRGAARRIGTDIPVKTSDCRFLSPRGSARSTSSNEPSTPRHEPTAYSSDEEPQKAPSFYKDIAFSKATKSVDAFSLVRHNRIDDVRDVLDNGLPVNIQDAHGNTLLIIACQNGLKRLTKELLRRGANINAQNSRGNTPLHFCFAYGYGDSLGAYLISKGADVTIRNSNNHECYYGIETPI